MQDVVCDNIMIELLWTEDTLGVCMSAGKVGRSQDVPGLIPCCWSLLQSGVVGKTFSRQSISAT